MLPLGAGDYLKELEILNRQSLPLRSNLNRRFKEYFINNDQFNYENDSSLSNEQKRACGSCLQL
jgi:hypothetical protein